jgi:hypothetical protein
MMTYTITRNGRKPTPQNPSSAATGVCLADVSLKEGEFVYRGTRVLVRCGCALRKK